MKPETTRCVPAIVLASAIHGVDDDLRAIADDFASHGYIAAAPDLFWRTIPGPLPRDDERCVQRSEPRRQKLRIGEPDLSSVLLALRREPTFNGRAVLMGFCYGGPYAILGPNRLGYDAGVACHGTRMMSVIHDLRALRRPVEVLWGDQDRMAPGRVLRAYDSVQEHNPNVRVHVLSGVRHGYMMCTSPAFDPAAYEFSMARALGLLSGLHRATAAAQADTPMRTDPTSP